MSAAAPEPSAPSVAERFRSNVRKLYAIRFLFWTHFISSVLIPFYRDWGGIDFTQILVLNAWFMLWIFLLEVPTGTVADFWSRKASLALGCTAGSVATLIYVSTPHYGVFLAAEFIYAGAFALQSGADEALLYDSLEAAGESRRSKQAFARLESFKLAGIVTGALLGSPLAAHFGLRAPVLLQAVPMALAALLSLTLHEPARLTPGKGRVGYRETLVQGVKTFARHRVLRFLTLDMVITGSFVWIIIWLYQPLLEAAGIGLAFFGVVHALMSLGQIAVLSQISRLEALLGSKRRLLLAGTLIPGAAYAFLGASASAPLVVIAIVTAASFGLSRGPLFSSYMNKHIPSDRRATVLSTVSMLRTAAIAVVNPISGMLADWSIRGTMGVLAGALLLSAFVSRVREEHLID